MTQAWDQARAAQHRPLRKPIKMHGPVGDDRLNFVCHGTQGEHIVLPHRVTAGDRCQCRGCGYHVCSCERLTEFGKVFASCTKLPDVPMSTELVTYPMWRAQPFKAPTQEQIEKLGARLAQNGIR